jgi:hypothetical protein
VVTRGPQDEAEALRQLNREAHEAIKDARLAVRQLRDERAEHTRYLQEVLQIAAGDVSREIRDAGTAIVGHLQSEALRISDHIAEILGATSPQALANRIAAQAAADVADQLILTLEKDRGRHPRT